MFLDSGPTPGRDTVEVTVTGGKLSDVTRGREGVNSEEVRLVR